MFTPYLSDARQNWLAELVDKDKKSQEDLLAIRKLLTSEDDVEIYIRSWMTLTFNDVTKKITSLVCCNEVTDLKAVQFNVDE